MIMWIVLGYLAASMIASLVFYAACVAAAYADEMQQQRRFGKNASFTSEFEAKRAETSTSRLALNA